MGLTTSTWLARRVVDLVHVLTDLYYTHKYGALARRLGRSSIEPDQRRGFIIIQIDGLSHDHLMQAVAAGYMPYLGRLFTERRLAVAPWRCGLPSTTPAVQAGMMFGNRFDIPGFRWYEKERRQGMSAKRPNQVQAMRARISGQGPGILRGGSCYVSLFDGDADLALFTLSTMQPRRFFESVRGMGLFLLFFLSPFRVLRLLRYTAMGYLAGLGRRLAALVRPSVLNPFDILSPLVHAVADALFTEVQTFGVMLDIYRRAPAIYANYNSYDEVAHKLGADHPAAFRVLRDVDKRIRQINRMRARYRRREYDLYVMSDHGNSPAMPFSWRNGASLGKYIASQIGQDLRVDERATSYAHSTEKTQYLMEELRALGHRLSPRLRRALGAVHRYVDRRVPSIVQSRHSDGAPSSLQRRHSDGAPSSLQRRHSDGAPSSLQRRHSDGAPSSLQRRHSDGALTDQDMDYDLERQEDVVVSASGPLAHVYFNVSPRALNLIEAMLLYPQLTDRLLANPGIGAIAGRAEAQTIVLGQEGGMLVIGAGHEVARWPHPLTPFGDAAYAASQIHRLAHFPHAGDLIVLGASDSDGQVTTFEEQAATHGGLGGPQMRPFIAWPPEQALAPEALNDAQDLYPYFVQHYQVLPVPDAGHSPYAGSTRAPH